MVHKFNLISNLSIFYLLSLFVFQGGFLIILGSLAVARKSDFHWLDLTIAFVFITMNCFVL
jgi:hypothetical protein